MARLVELATDRLLVAGYLDLEILAHVNPSHARVTHMGQRTLNGLTLRVENCLLRSDDDLSFHCQHGRNRGIEGRMLRKQTLLGENFFNPFLTSLKPDVPQPRQIKNNQPNLFSFKVLIALK